jgi:hypothetical protein
MSKSLRDGENHCPSDRGTESRVPYAQLTAGTCYFVKLQPRAKVNSIELSFPFVPGERKMSLKTSLSPYRVK